MTNKNDSLRLYLDAFWFSPYSFSVYVTLKEKGISFETVEVALHRGEADLESYRKRSITGRIPAIEHGDFWLAESNAIIDYLEEIFPSPGHPSIYPEKVQDRAKARMILSWLRSSRDLMPLFKERSAETIFYENHKATAPLSKEGHESAEKLIEVADLMILGGKDQLFDQWCIADNDLAFCLARLSFNDFPVSQKIHKFINRQWSRPSVRSFLDRKRPEFVPY